MNTPRTLLGGLSVKAFLIEYWQKKPLLIRQAIPDFKGLLTPKQLINLACEGDAQARLVTQLRGRFTLNLPPFSPEHFEGFGKTHWTVLLQGVNHYLPEAAALIQQFDFIPHTRLDDLMVSFAPKGGGVGPHFDSYDVFLLQGMGRRNWQISAQADRTLVEGAPLRILKDFKPELEWVLEPGDMLYLPPQYAHNGIAESDCMTYSIGFRTPSYQELAEQFLVYLQDRVSVDGMYSDPDLATQIHPSEVSSPMIDQVSRALDHIRWDKEDVANFLGCYLSEPKPHIFFESPHRPLSPSRFLQAMNSKGITLNLKSQLLCHRGSVFMNGEAYTLDKSTYARIRQLADSRALPTSSSGYDQKLCDILYAWYLDGFLELVKIQRRIS